MPSLTLRALGKCGNGGHDQECEPRPARGGMQVERSDIARRLDVLLTVLAFLVLPSILLETVAEDPTILRITNVMDWLIWLGFGATLVALYAVFPDRRAFARRHTFDVLIVVLTPPLAPEAWQAFRALRVLRFLRLVLAGFRLHRFMRGIARVSIVGPAAVVLVVVVVGAAIALRLIEPEATSSFSSSVWWAISRVTALGDGGIAPETITGRALELAVVLSGLAFLSLITAATATIFVRAEKEADPPDRLGEVITRLDRIEQRLERGGSDVQM